MRDIMTHQVNTRPQHKSGQPGYHQPHGAMYPKSTTPINQAPFYSPLPKQGAAKNRVRLTPIKIVTKPLEYEDIYNRRRTRPEAPAKRYSMREDRGRYTTNDRNQIRQGALEMVFDQKGGKQMERSFSRNRHGSFDYGYRRGSEGHLESSVVIQERPGNTRGTVDNGVVMMGNGLHYGNKYSKPGVIKNNTVDVGQVRFVVNDRKEVTMVPEGSSRDANNTAGTRAVAQLRLVVDKKDPNSHHLVSSGPSSSKEHTRDNGGVHVIVQGCGGSLRNSGNTGNSVDIWNLADTKKTADGGTHTRNTWNSGNTRNLVDKWNSVDARNSGEQKKTKLPQAVSSLLVSDYHVNSTRDHVVNQKDERAVGSAKGKEGTSREEKLPNASQSRNGQFDRNNHKPQSQVSFPDVTKNVEFHEPRNENHNIPACVVTKDNLPLPNPHMPRSVSPALSLTSNTSQMTHNSGASGKSEVSVKSILKKPKAGRIVMKEEPSAYTVFAFISCILCFPCGIYALVQSNNVKNAIEVNDYEWALSSSKNVKRFCIGVAMVTVGVLLIGGGLLAKYLITGTLF